MSGGLTSQQKRTTNSTKWMNTQGEWSTKGLEQKVEYISYFADLQMNYISTANFHTQQKFTKLLLWSHQCFRAEMTSSPVYPYLEKLSIFGKRRFSLPWTWDDRTLSQIRTNWHVFLIKSVLNENFNYLKLAVDDNH